MKITDESLFKRMLLLERRRCERSGSRFALMLIDMRELSESLGSEGMEEVGGAISSAMRETDLTGWYSSSIIGVILTTLNGACKETLESVVVERVKDVLSLNLPSAQMHQIWISCHIFPEDQEVRIPGGRRDGGFHADDGQANTAAKHSSAAKRVVDVVGSLAAIILSSPFLLGIALLIKWSSPGPILFRQKRIGQFGREFTFLKFRSMVVNNDPGIHKAYIQNLIQNKVDGADGPFKIKNDPRVTPIGRFIRKTSLDELPQFLNVLKGDMSLVGPRPPIPYEFESYSLWHRRRSLEAKPGITGIWQVEGRSRTTFDEMVRMDLRYIRNQSLWLDVKILLKTPFAVLGGDGAY